MRSSMGSGGTHRAGRWGAVALAALALPSAALAAGSLPGNQHGRMTGGGNVLTGSGAKVTHGFTLRCPEVRGPNRLQVNWKGHRFHLESLSSIRCTDALDYEEGKPEAGFDTYRGVGTGRLDGVSGATIDFKFGDAGEPGTEDPIRIIIHDPSGRLVLGLAPARTLRHGNHQAHR